MGDWRRIWRTATTGGAPQRALLVALVIGTLLNLINQGDAFFGHAAFHWAKAGLTYLVPFVVSMHGQVSARLALAAS